MQLCNCTLYISDPMECKNCQNINGEILPDQYYEGTTEFVELDKEEIEEIVIEKLREYGANFAFLNKDYLKILLNIIVDSIIESETLKANSK